MKYIICILLLSTTTLCLAQLETEIRPDGIVIPRTLTSSVTGPVDGLMIFDTSSMEFMYYDGSWNSLGGGFFNPITGGISYTDGNVAIGRTASDATLWIENPGVGDVLRIRKDNATQMRIFQNGAISLGANWNGATEPEVIRMAAPKMIVEDSMVVDGFVGIGTRSPSAKFTVRSRNGTDAMRIIHENSTIMQVYDNRAISIGSSWGSPEPNVIWLNGDKTIVSDSLVMNGGDIIMRASGSMSFMEGTEERIRIDNNVNGDGRVSTDELQINGGSDLAEFFDVTDKTGILPGMVVSIADDFGRLKLSSKKRDRQVVGIISGANGIKPGMFMGQKGSIADGEYPIAITGRVYVRTNNENGIIKSGDFLTSSSIPGEAMRVKKIKRSQGAIIGKALTTAKDGFVLVLVNLQ